MKRIYAGKAIRLKDFNRAANSIISRLQDARSSVGNSCQPMKVSRISRSKDIEGRLNAIALLPGDAIAYVVAHEAAHLVHLDHRTLTRLLRTQACPHEKTAHRAQACRHNRGSRTAGCRRASAGRRRLNAGCGARRQGSTAPRRGRRSPAPAALGVWLAGAQGASLYHGQAASLAVRRKSGPAHPPAGAGIRTAPPVVDPHQADAETRRRVSGPGVRTFIAIADRWRLSEDERLRVLGLLERAVYDDWIARARERRELTLSLDVLLRISGVLGVYKALIMLYGDDVAEAVAWLRGPHGAPSFGGQPPMAFLTDGTLEGILRVRRYLDWFIHNG